MNSSSAGDFTKMLGLIRWESLLTALCVLVGAHLFLRLARATERRLSERFVRARRSLHMVAALLRLFIYVAAAFAAVAVIVGPGEPLAIALGAVLVLAAGLALKDLAASVIAGAAILLDERFEVGDRVDVAGVQGQITEIGLSSVRLRTLDDCAVTIPSHRFLAEMAASRTGGGRIMQVPCDFYIGADQDVELAQKLVEEAVLSSRHVFLGKPVVVHVAQLIHESHFAVRLKVRAYVLDVAREEDFATDVTKRVIRAFRESGILPPAVLHRERMAPAIVRRGTGAELVS